MLKTLTLTIALLCLATALTTERHAKTKMVLRSRADEPESQQVFRWSSSRNEDHFYTLDPTGEKAPKSGYTYQGVEFCTLKKKVSGSTPLYRLYAGRDHFYTIDENEALNSGYVEDGNIGYVFSIPTTVSIKDSFGNLKTQKAVPLYRADNFYFTEGSAENQEIAAYVLPCQEPAKKVKESEIQQVFRWFSAGALDHFYTLDPKGDAAAQYGYEFQGTEFCTLKTQTLGSTPFYRLYFIARADHYYTTDADDARRSGFNPEGNIGYIFQNPTTLTVVDANGNFVKNQKTVPLYRWFNPVGVDHFYFTNPAVEHHTEFGYKDEGIAGYVFPCKQ